MRLGQDNLSKNPYFRRQCISREVFAHSLDSVYLLKRLSISIFFLPSESLLSIYFLNISHNLSVSMFLLSSFSSNLPNLLKRFILAFSLRLEELILSLMRAIRSSREQESSEGSSGVIVGSLTLGATASVVLISTVYSCFSPVTILS